MTNDGRHTGSAMTTTRMAMPGYAAYVASKAAVAASPDGRGRSAPPALAVEPPHDARRDEARHVAP
jgi:hypothetical protein